VRSDQPPSPSAARPKRNSAFNRALIPIFLIQLIGAMGYGIVFPLLPYYGAELGATPFINGLLAASYALCAFVAGPLLGQLSDRLGRRPVLIVSLIGTVIGFVFLGIGGSLFMLFLGRIIDGITGGNIVVAQAYVNDVVRPEERTQTFGLMGASFGAGFALGPVLGSALSIYGLSVPMYAAAVLTTIAVIVTYFLLPESINKNAPLKTQRTGVLGQFATIAEVFTRKELIPLLLLFSIMTFSMMFFFSSLGQYMQLQVKVPPNQAGWPAAAFGISNIIFQVFLLRTMVKTFGERSLIPMGFAAILICTMGVYFTSSLVLTMAFNLFMSLGMTLLRPAITSLVTQKIDPREGGKVLGVNASIDSLAQIVAPIAGGWLIEAFNPGMPSLVSAVIASLGIALFLGVRSTLPARANERPVGVAPAAGR
jgi:MFS family permease